MARTNHRKQRKTLLTSPGTLTYVGEKTSIKTVIKRIEYNESFYEEEIASTLEVCVPKEVPSAQSYVTWLNVTGIHEPKVMEQIGQLYQLHPLLLEDVMNSYQKPKVETYEDGHLFVTLKMLHLSQTKAGTVWGEHVSFVLGKDYLVSFQEQQSGDIFSPVIDRLKASVGKTRRSGPDYLLYALLDIIVDNYFLLLENFGDQLDTMEDLVINGRSQLFTGRSVWPET